MLRNDYHIPIILFLGIVFCIDYFAKKKETILIRKVSMTYLKDVFEGEVCELGGPVSGHDVADSQSSSDSGPGVAHVHRLKEGLEVGLGEGHDPGLAFGRPLDELKDPRPLVQLYPVEGHPDLVQVFEGFFHGLVAPAAGVEALKVRHEVVLTRPVRQRRNKKVRD